MNTIIITEGKHPILMIMSFCLLLTSCGTAQKMNSNKQLEERVAKLEAENSVLRADMKKLQLQLSSVMEQVLPKPTRGGNGGARPLDDDSMEQQLPANLTAIQLPELQHDFGTIVKNSSVTHEFKVKNVGTNPLKIENVKASCGCTVPEWPKEPIAPGAEGKIKVTFNSAGKRGVQNKAITITANTDPINTRLYIKATIAE
ncbi:MAG: DUF1573 domain-containing protein [Aureispira sp.]